MIRTVTLAVVSIAVLCLVNVPTTSALRLSEILKEATAPLTNLLSKDDQKSSDQTEDPDKPTQPAEQPATNPNQAPSEPNPAESTTGDSTTPDKETAIVPLPIVEETRTVAQLGPPPSASISQQTSRHIPASNSVFASILSVDRPQSLGATIERTPDGWRLAGVLWYWWLLVILIVVATTLYLKYRWGSGTRKVALSKK